MTTDINTKLLEAVISSLPYSNQIKDLDLSSEASAIRFTWRGARYRVSNGLYVEEVRNSSLAGSDIAILMQDLLRVKNAMEAAS